MINGYLNSMRNHRTLTKDVIAEHCMTLSSDGAMLHPHVLSIVWAAMSLNSSKPYQAAANP